MAIETYVASQVLTAAELNTTQKNDYNQTVSTKTASYTLVAADKGTRVVMNVASANTVTVNTSLFSAGDTLVIQNIGAGVATVTAGTATVSSAGPLAIPQYGSGTLYFTSAGVAIFFPSAGPAASSGLTLVSATTIGTSVSTVTVNSAFSATYDQYLITINGGTATGTGASISLSFGAATSGYRRSLQYAAFSGNTFTGDSDNSASALIGCFGATTTNLSGEAIVQNPFLAKPTIVFSKFAQNISGGQSISSAGTLDDSTSYTSFNLTNVTMTGGTIRVYGYANS